MKNKIWFLSLQILLILSLSISSFPRESMALEVDDEAPDFTLKVFATKKEKAAEGYKEKTITLSDYRGRISTSEFQDKELVTKLIKAKILRADENDPNHVFFGDEIEDEEKLKESLKKAKIEETEAILNAYKKAQSKKKIVLIQFWANWCAICKRQMPHLVKYYNDNKKLGDYETLAVLMGATEKDQNDIEKVIKKYKIPFPVVLDDDAKVYSEVYKFTGIIPVIAIIDQEGFVSFLNHAELEEPEFIEFTLEDLRGEGEEE